MHVAVCKGIVRARPYHACMAFRLESFDDFAKLPKPYLELIDACAPTFDQTETWYRTFAEYLQRCGGLDRLQELRQQEFLLNQKKPGG